jgi:small conductance mechanosensitive channel
MDETTLEETMAQAKVTWSKLSLEDLIGTLLLLVVGIIVIKLVMTLLQRLTDRSSMDHRVRRYLLRCTSVVLYVLLALMVATSLGVDVTSLIALVSVFGLAVSLAVQDVLSNVAGGLVLLMSKPFALGDYVDTSDGSGTVEEITLTHVKLDTPDGQRLVLPTSKVTAGKIVNYTTLGKRRVDHTVTASYDDSCDAVRRACLRAVERTGGVLPEPKPEVVVTNYGESAIEYHVRFWTSAQDYWPARNGSLEEIRRCFEEDGVTMTYNHLNIHMIDERNEKGK